MAVFVMAGPGAFSQVSDAGLWIGVNLEKKITPELTLCLEDELRLNENVTEAGTHYTEIGAEYRLVKGLSAGLFYRFTQKRRVDDSYSRRHRFFTELSYRKRADKFTVVLRERLQMQYKDVYSSETGKVPEYYWRSKLSLRYKLIKRLQLYTFGEVFYQLSNPEGNEIDNYRVAAGLTYSLKEYGSVSLFYLVDREINVNDPVTGYITGIEYNFSF